MDVVGYDDEVEENSMTSLEEDAEIQSSVGSSNEMAEGDDIPFGAVSHSILKRMAVYLEPLCDLGDRDWRALASKILNASPAQIMYLQSLQKPDGSNTMSVFGEYLNYPHSSVGKVISALEEMNRDDVAKILKDALPSIAAFWKRQREAWERQNITKTGFIEHEDPYHENQSLRSPNRLFVGGVSGGSVSIRDTVIRERQQPDVQVSHIDSTALNDGSNEIPSVVAEINSAVQNTYHSNPLMSTAPSIERKTHHLIMNQSHSPVPNQTRWSGACAPPQWFPTKSSPGSEPLDLSLENSNQSLSSLAVNMSVDHSEEISYASERTVSIKVETPASVEKVLLRAVSDNECCEEMELGAEEEVCTSIPEDSAVVHSGKPNRFARLMAKLTPGGFKKQIVECEKTEVFKKPQSYARQQHAHRQAMHKDAHCKKKEECHSSSQCSNSYSDSHVSNDINSNPPAACTQYTSPVTHSLTSPKPASNHSRSNGTDQSRQYQPSLSWPPVTNQRRPSHSSASSDGDKAQNHNTYPRMRPAEKHPSTTQMHRPICNSKSSSAVMQRGPFSKVSRPSVFVTYSVDSQEHIQKVLSFVDCLKTNDFAVTFDQFDRCLKEFQSDVIGWLSRKFRTVDKVIVCISPQYRRDIISDPEGPSAQHSLHTRFIYKQMESEFINQRSLNYRFVPVIFPGGSKQDMPIWLQNGIVYEWPRLWKDLFYFLINPEAKMKKAIQEKTTTMPSVANGISESAKPYPVVYSRRS